MDNIKLLCTNLKKKLDSRLNERANLLIWWILMMPVMIAFLALAVDSAAVHSTKTSLKSALDASTQGILALSSSRPSGQPTLGTTSQARTAFINLYDRNRTGLGNGGQSIPFVQCQRASDMKPGQSYVNPPASRCGFGITQFSYRTVSGSPVLSVTVSEKADTIFMQILGLNELYYTISSSARLAGSNS